MINKNKIARSMAESLIFEAEQKNVSLQGITKENFSDFLDSLFNDGGEIRCEKFTDLSIEYSMQFGNLESFEAMATRMKCAELAIDIINKKFNFTRK